MKQAGSIEFELAPKQTWILQLCNHISPPHQSGLQAKFTLP